ncbi:hypothetical protein SGGBAA2069_c19700 [Streptococcus gallolyticus subsp. gallolyticus ATCC BAA-2069]|nr:hypothetical protein SGGBAA2069_c19700 [Streptococcus gallolyticus subsp. gallolyticus ATCC BAA-2069]
MMAWTFSIFFVAVYDRKMTFYDLEKAFKNFSATINH